MKILLIVILVLCLVSCTATPNKTPNETSSETVVVEPVTSVEIPDGEMFTDRDLNTSYENAVEINDGVIEKAGDYVVSGKIDGQIAVDCGKNDKVHLILNGVEMTNENSAPIYIKNADKVVITLIGENSLVTNGEFVSDDENNIDGVIFSKADLSINGEGSLNITSPKHGIVCKDDLVIAGSTISINSTDHAIDSNDSVRVKSADLKLTSKADGIHCENEEDASKGFLYIESGKINITSDGDGISSSAYSKILGGEFDITSGGGAENAVKNPSGFGGEFGGFGGGRFEMGEMPDMGDFAKPDMENMPSRPSGGGRPNGGEMPNMPNGGFEDFGQGEFAPEQNIPAQEDDTVSAKGIKATGAMKIDGGVFKINSQDDAIHSNLSIEINGGEFNIASGDDGVHADETLVVNGGKIDITESYEGLEALYLTINGGDISAVSSDDGLNAAGGNDQSGFGGGRGDRFGMSSGNGSVKITNGNVYLKASGDGIDANGTLEITGGKVIVCGPTTGDTAVLDYDKTATIGNATFIGTGSVNMAQTFTTAENGLISIKSGSQQSGTAITIKDKNGNVIISHTPEYSFEILIVTAPDLVKGESYTLTIGETSQQITAK